MAVAASLPESVSLTDARVEPLLKAMDEIDRTTLGFTPVTTNAHISLELRSSGSYDAMLHVYGTTSRTIAFRKTPSGYRWISEQEIYEGPKWEQTVDGTFRESIVIEYQTEPVNGVPVNQLSIRYSGGDTNLVGRELTLAQARSILEKWSTTPVEARPPDLPGAGLEPFALLMLLALLAVCCLALMIGAVCFAIVALMLADRNNFFVTSDRLSSAKRVGGFSRIVYSAGCISQAWSQAQLQRVA